LQIPAVDSSGNVIINTWDYAAFYVDNGKLFRVVEANAASSRQSGSRLLAESLLSISFTYDNANMSLVRRVDADIQTRQIGRSFTASTHEQQRMNLRNF